MVLVVLLLRSGFIDAFIVVLMFLVALHEWLLIVREVHFHKYRPSSSSSFGTAAAVANASSSSVFDILSSPIIMKLVILIPTVGE